MLGGVLTGVFRVTKRDSLGNAGLKVRPPLCVATATMWVCLRSFQFP
jgi:hypothetical protein